MSETNGLEVKCPKCGKTVPSEAGTRAFLAEDEGCYVFVIEWHCEECGLPVAIRVGYPMTYDKSKERWRSR